MSLENEYFHLKQELKSEEETLKKFEAIDISDKTDEQIEARNSGIARVKKSIKEIKELIEEVEEELKEFIQNGGEVSQITIDELQESNETDPFEITVHFKIVSNKNENVYIEGYVDINDEEAEDVDWYYWNGSGYNNNQIIWHDGVQITGATWEQENEIAQFESDLVDDNEWITDAILQSNDDENRTHVRENVTLIINEGAKIECEIRELESHEYRGDFVVEVIPKWNGEKIDDFAEYMKEFSEEFDPWNVEDDSTSVEKGHIYFEMSKDYWDDDFRDELMDDVNEEARRIFARILTWRLGVYAKYGEVIEQVLDGDYDDDWLRKLALVTDDNLDAFLRNQGLIDEELE